MPCYFFDVFDGADAIDTVGTQLADVEEAKLEAACLAAGLLRDDPARFWTADEWSVRVSDQQRLTLFVITLFANLAPILSEAPSGRGLAAAASAG